MHRQPGHKAGQVVGVRSDIAQASARTAPFRIGSPIRLLLPGPFQRGRQPVLRVLYLNNAKRPEFARLPKNLVASYITERGCPTYFQTPREYGWPWAKRQFLGLVAVPGQVEQQDQLPEIALSPLMRTCFLL